MYTDVRLNKPLIDILTYFCKWGDHTDCAYSRWGRTKAV